MPRKTCATPTPRTRTLLHRDGPAWGEWTIPGPQDDYIAFVKKTGLIAIGAVVLVAVMVGGSYNGLVSLDQAVRAQWGQV